MSEYDEAVTCTGCNRGFFKYKGFVCLDGLPCAADRAPAVIGLGHGVRVGPTAAQMLGLDAIVTKPGLEVAAAHLRAAIANRDRCHAAAMKARVEKDRADRAADQADKIVRDAQAALLQAALDGLVPAR